MCETTRALAPPNQLAPDALLARLCADPCSPRSSQSAFRSLYTRVRYACALSAPSAASRLRTALFPPSFALPSALCAPGTLGDFGCYTSAIYEKVEKARGEGRPLPPLLLYSTSPTPLPRPHTPNPWICAGRGWFRHHVQQPQP